MKRQKSYYSADINEFLNQPTESIFGIICASSDHFQTQLQQNNAWGLEIDILKLQLSKFKSGRIIFEYVIPRMGKRIDVVFLYRNIVFLLEFKCGDDEYRTSTFDQVYDYASDLRNFQKESEEKLLVPIIVSTKAPTVHSDILETDRIIAPLKCNDSNISAVIDEVASRYSEPDFDYVAWENSEYFPTPTIIEAAQALYPLPPVSLYT